MYKRQSLSNSLARVSSETGSFLDISTNNSSNSKGDKSYNIVKRSLIDEFILVMELTEEDGIFPNYRLLPCLISIATSCPVMLGIAVLTQYHESLYRRVA